jgi:hypothetical protein
MNPAHAVALANHCRLAVETANPQFGFTLRSGLSVVLTVNSGYE